MVSGLVSGSIGLGSSPGRRHGVVFLGKTLYSHSASLQSTQVYKWVPANLMLGVTLRWTSIWPDKPLGSYADLTYLTKLDKCNAVSIGTTAVKPHFSIGPVGLVWFARYFGKMYSRHFFSYGGLPQWISLQDP